MVETHQRLVHEWHGRLDKKTRDEVRTLVNGGPLPELEAHRASYLLRGHNPDEVERRVRACRRIVELREYLAQHDATAIRAEHAALLRKLDLQGGRGTPAEHERVSVLEGKLSVLGSSVAELEQHVSALQVWA